jgi:two-component system OmpR family response regulator
MKTVLVIDDNEDLVVLFSRMIRSGGYEVLTALNAEEVMKVLEKTVPDLILLDLMMSPVDGWEILSNIRSRANMSLVPVVIFTAKIPGNREISEHIGEIDDYIMKPVTHEEIVKVIRDTESRCYPLQGKLEKKLRSGADKNLILEYLSLQRERYTRKKVRAISDQILHRVPPTDTFDVSGASPEEIERLRAVEAKLRELEQILQL